MSIFEELCDFYREDIKKQYQNGAVPGLTIEPQIPGELIKKAEVFIGYNHRGIEKLTEVRNYIQTITLVERVCGICSHSHAMTYCLAVEDIAGLEVPKRGQYIRIIISELERLHSHFMDWTCSTSHSF